MSCVYRRVSNEDTGRPSGELPWLWQGIMNRPYCVKHQNNNNNKEKKGVLIITQSNNTKKSNQFLGGQLEQVLLGGPLVAREAKALHERGHAIGARRLRAADGPIRLLEEQNKKEEEEEEEEEEEKEEE